MRAILAALALLAVLLSAAFGGDDSPDVTPAGTEEAGPTLPPVIPTPTPVPANLPVLVVSTFQKEYQPTAADLRALPSSDVEAKGKKTGISLSTLGEKVQAGPSSFVTVRGLSPDGRRDMFIRYPLAQVGATTVLVVDDQGYARLYSSSIPESEWLTHVASVSYP